MSETLNDNGPAPTVAAVAPGIALSPDATTNVFTPAEPASLRETDLTESEVEALILKFLLTRGDATGREIADHVKLPFVMVDGLLRDAEE